MGRRVTATEQASNARAQAHAHEIEQRFRLLIGSVRDYAIFMLDPEGRVMSWNPGAELVKGYTADEIIGQSLEVFYPPESRAAGRPAYLLAQAREHGRVEDEGWRVRKDGTRFWADVVLSAMRDESGTLTGYAKVTRDLTERRRLEEERVRRAQAEEALRLRDEFLAIASHELRTPLAALQLQLDGLQRLVGSNPRVGVRVEHARSSSLRLIQLVDTLLDVSRIATGRFELDPEPCDVAAIVQEVVDDHREVAARAGCELTAEVAGPIPCHGDKVRIEQVVTNLLTNAIKYGAGAPIEVTAGHDGGVARIEVRDRGPGIAPADLERIFERFERATAVRNYAGLGLGLYVAREIVTAHGGTIAVTLREGGGAIFAVTLPIAPTRPA